MRLLLPGVRVRRRVDDLLVSYFHGHQDVDFNKAIELLSDFYKIKPPKVRWFEYLDRGHTLGYCDDTSGEIDLIYPPHWVKKKIGSDRLWVRVVLHEFAHYLFWANAEQKAWQFADRFITGLKAPG